MTWLLVAGVAVFVAWNLRRDRALARRQAEIDRILRDMRKGQ